MASAMSAKLSHPGFVDGVLVDAAGFVCGFAGDFLIGTGIGLFAIILTGWVLERLGA